MKVKIQRSVPLFLCQFHSKIGLVKKVSTTTTKLNPKMDNYLNRFDLKVYKTLSFDHQGAIAFP
jgi:hypothetical protein